LQEQPDSEPVCDEEEAVSRDLNLFVYFPGPAVGGDVSRRVIVPESEEFQGLAAVVVNGGTIWGDVSRGVILKLEEFQCLALVFTGGNDDGYHHLHDGPFCFLSTVVMVAINGP
jgi:hypothetical protein